jgi:cell fate (sporulation/competence/biofilm development) regulator YlbF (YheA/YmcA/DUF963 family)
MKISIAASILILLVAALFGFQNHQRLVTVRASHAKLVASAAQLGITIDPSRPDDSVRITKRERVDKEADAKAAAAEFIAFAREMEAMQKKGGPPDESQQKRVLEFMDRMMSLDSAQLKILIAEVRAAKDLEDELRKGLIVFTIMTLSNDHPQAALALLTESSDLFEQEGMSEHVVSSSLAKWAKDDPFAAVDWVRKNSAKFPDLITDDAKQGLISGAAIGDPRLAFKLIGELGLKETAGSVIGIIGVAKTPEERTATLAALREHEATIQDEKARKEFSDRAVGAFADAVGKDGFDAGSKWIAEAKLTPAELESLASDLSGSVKDGEQGKWIEWIGKTLPPEKIENDIRNLVSNWTRNDYQAAGKWLAAAPAGPAKDASVRSYAETISKYEPETAAQWAMTLPPGKDRDRTLRSIHRNWPESDSAGKEAFKKEHNIR